MLISSHPSSFDSAMVYGASSKHPRGQRVGLDHILMDEGEKRESGDVEKERGSCCP